MPLANSCFVHGVGVSSLPAVSSVAWPSHVHITRTGHSHVKERNGVAWVLPCRWWADCREGECVFIGPNSCMRMWVIQFSSIALLGYPHYSSSLLFTLRWTRRKDAISGLKQAEITTAKKQPTRGLYMEGICGPRPRDSHRKGRLFQKQKSGEMWCTNTWNRYVRHPNSNIKGIEV